MPDYVLSSVDPQGNTWRNFQASNASTGGKRILGGALVANSTVTGDTYWAPDSAPLSITGDIDIQVRARGIAWSTGSGVLIGKWAVSGQFSYRLIQSGGALRLDLTTTGTTPITGTSSISMNTAGFANGSSAWVRVTWRQSDGRAQFFTAPDSLLVPSAWTQMGTDITIAAASIFDGTSVLELGSSVLGTTPFLGDIHRVRILSGIGGTVAFDADFAQLQDDTFAFTESSVNAAMMHHGNTVTPAGTRSVVNADITSKTVPGTITATPSGRIFYMHNITTPGMPSLRIAGGKWVQFSQGQSCTVPTIDVTSTPATGRNAIFAASDSQLTTVNSGGTVNVSFADVYRVTAGGASIPFVDVNGYDATNNTNWAFVPPNNTSTSMLMGV